MNSTLVDERTLYAIIQTIAEGTPTVTRDTNFLSDLHFDSMTSIFLITTIEDRFGIDIPMNKIMSVKTCGELYDTVKSIRNKSQGAIL